MLSKILILLGIGYAFSELLPLEIGSEDLLACLGIGLLSTVPYRRIYEKIHN